MGGSMSFSKLAGAALAVGMATSANAAVVDAVFDFSASALYAGPGSALSFTSGGLKVSVTGHTYTDGTSPTFTGNIGIGTKTGTNGGIGACDAGDVTKCKGDPNLDANPLPELLKFTFTDLSDNAVDVKMADIFFSLTDMGASGDHFDLFYGTPLAGGDATWDNTYAIHGGVPVATPIGVGFYSMFAVGLDDETSTGKSDKDQVRILSMKVSYDDCPPGSVGCGPDVGVVPLPAGLPLLLSAFGVGAFVTRRSRKQA